MQIGMVGLGRMGANMVRRLLKGGHEVVVFNRSPKKVEDLVKEKAVGATSLADLVKKLQTPRTVWLMVPAAAVDGSIAMGDAAMNGDPMTEDTRVMMNDMSAKSLQLFVDVPSDTRGTQAGRKRAR